MKNSAKIAAAEEILATARSLGFENAHIRFAEAFETGLLYDTLEEIAEDYTPNDKVSVSIHLILDDDLAFELVEDPDDESGDPIIEYIK